MDNGTTFAQTYQLRPGVALSAGQMAALTSDIVWLVEKEVTLPDGQVTRVLVPQVYVQVRDVDLKPDGTLLGGEQVRLTLTGDLNNRGTIAGRHVVNLNAANVANLGGTIAGGSVSVNATTNIDSTVGQFRADKALVLTAGNDITVASTTRSQSTAQGSRANVERVAGLYVSRDDGQLVVAAGHDLGLTGAVIQQGQPAASEIAPNSAATEAATASAKPATGRVVLAAGNDIRLDTVTKTRSERVDWDGGNHRSESGRTGVATSIDAAGAVDIVAGRDLVSRGAQIAVSEGAISVNAGHDVLLTPAESQASVDESHRHTSSGLLSSTTYSDRDMLEQTTQQGTLLSGNQVSVQAGQDIKVSGSNVASSMGTVLDAERNVIAEAATDTRHETHLSKKKTSELMGSGGLGVTIGKRSLKTHSDTTATTAAASTVGSTDADVGIRAGDTVHQSGSTVLAPQGDVTIAGRKVDIVSAHSSETTVTSTQFRQSGLTAAVSNPVVSAVQTAQQMSEAASNTKDGRMKALAAANTAMAAANAYDAVKAGQGTTINGNANQISTGSDAAGNGTSRDANAADQMGGIQVAISVGTSKSDSRTVATRSDAVASNVGAGGKVTITAKGNRQQSDVTVQGSQIAAGKQVSVTADHALNLQAAANTQTQQSAQTNSGASVGVVMDTHSGFGVNISGSKGRGNADGSDLVWTPARVTAGQQATLQSGTDTTIKGASVSAPQVTVASAAQLNIESLQDRSSYQSSQKQAGGSLTIGTAPSANLNYAKDKIDSTYMSVTEQSGLRAGDGGFDVTVTTDTNLKGGAITGTPAAVDAKRNAFTSGGALKATDIGNRASYQAESVSVNLGTGFSAQGALAAAGTGVGFRNDRDQASSTTRSGISDVAGNTALRTGDKEAGIAKIFDADTVQKEVSAQTQITQMFSALAPRRVAAYAGGKVREINEQLSKEVNPARRAALLAERQRWDEGGTYRVLMHTAVGGLVGDVSGGAGAGMVAGAAPALNDLQTKLEGSLVKAGMNPAIAQGVAANVNGLGAAGIGAAAGGAAGAGLGLSVDANNWQLHPNETKWIRDNAKRFSQQQGISEQEAEMKLAQQAFRQVQFGVSGSEDAQARNFLRQANGMLTADPTCASCGPGYMFYATPVQKATTGMYATQVLSDPKVLEFYGKNGITQSTQQQIQASATKDANVRSNIENATVGAAGTAATLTVPPALSWCLANPVACNRIVIAGGEIAAGDALGPVGLGVVGTTSLVRSVRSADEVNAAMKARGWEPAWSPGTPVIETTLQPGTKVNMIVDESGAANITKAIQSGDFNSVKLGGWATFSDVKSVATDMRQNAAITNQFKPSSNGPFYVVELEVQKPLNAKIGFAGPQQDVATNLRGGATQAEFFILSNEKRTDYLKPVSLPNKLGGY